MKYLLVLMVMCVPMVASAWCYDPDTGMYDRECVVTKERPVIKDKETLKERRDRKRLEDMIYELDRQRRWERLGL